MVFNASLLYNTFFCVLYYLKKTIILKFSLFLFLTFATSMGRAFEEQVMNDEKNCT